ncbi:ferrous iron transport protein B [Pyrofollis japonicus]|uniref:ferrous iron transport protein B n=1 Tax=Pyrofollis japonicus TaxID=3060460 RepID=UPI00295A8979|nr:ferrous iron transport protein B [Pyrofollis japonicus]
MTKRVLLLGQPNVGKSSLLRALTGARVQVSNYPGTTVEVTRASTVINGVRYEFVDTPGVYNLFPSSIEEEVTERALLSEDYDFVIVVLDATAIERGLVFAVSVAELGPRMIIAVNFWEEAEKKGIYIDYRGLEEAFGVPVVRINPVRKNGVRELVGRLGEARQSKIVIRYDDHIEEAIRRAEGCVTGPTRLSRRGLAVRLVEGDPLVAERFGCPEAEEARRRLVEEGHDPYRDVEIARAGYAISLSQRYVRVEPRAHGALTRLDVFLVQHPFFGLLTSLGFVLGIIVLTVVFGGLVIDWATGILDHVVDGVVGSLEGRGLLGLMAAKSVQALYAQYVSALPYVFIFYFILMLLEDSGLLTRIMIWLHAFTKKIGLYSKGIIPVLLGLGCSVPAITGTRILPSTRQRIVAISMLAFVPCSSRASIIFGIAGRFLGALAPIAIYLAGFTIALIIAKIVAKATRAEEEAILVEDIPPLRRPKLGLVAEKAWLRLEDFIKVVTPMIVAGAVAYAALTYYGVDSVVETVFSPLARLLGLPAATMIPLVYGFLQKDLVIAMLAAVLGTADFAKALTPHQIMTFTIASTYQVPCIIALGAMIREIGAKKAILLWIFLDAVGFAIAALYAHSPLPP